MTISRELESPEQRSNTDTKSVSPGSIEVSAKGQPVRVPCLTIQGRSLLVSGKWLKHAVVHDEEWLNGETFESPSDVVEALQSSDHCPDLLSFASPQPDAPPLEGFHSEWDNVAVIRTESYDTWWKGLSQDSRRNVRLAGKRGVEVRRADFDDAFVRGIKGIYDETPVRQGRKFWHYGKELEAVRRDNATYSERSAFIGAYLGEELIGFIKMVFVGKIARIMQILSMNAHFDKKPANAMIAKAVEIACEEGMTHLAYCRYVYGNKRNSSITEFKRRNGFEELRFPRYFVPLTWKGRIALALGFHRELKDRLPEPVIDFLLKTRAAVYAKLLRQQTPASATSDGE